MIKKTWCMERRSVRSWMANWAWEFVTGVNPWHRSSNRSAHVRIMQLVVGRRRMMNWLADMK